MHRSVIPESDNFTNVPNILKFDLSVYVEVCGTIFETMNRYIKYIIIRIKRR